VEEVGLPEVLNDRLLDRPLEGEVELLERLAGWEPCGFDPPLATVRLSGGDLGAEQHLGEPFIAPRLFAGAVGEHRQRPGRRRGFERSEQVRELGRGLGHAGISRS
jgi:hypothetical protein